MKTKPSFKGTWYLLTITYIVIVVYICSLEWITLYNSTTGNPLTNPLTAFIGIPFYGVCWPVVWILDTLDTNSVFASTTKIYYFLIPVSIWFCIDLIRKILYISRGQACNAWIEKRENLLKELNDKKDQKYQAIKDENFEEAIKIKTEISDLERKISSM